MLGGRIEQNAQETGKGRAALEWSKIKNIVLIILLTVNLCLLVLVASQEAHSARQRERARENAVRVLAQNGIAADLQRLPRDISLSRLSMERDREKEAGAASALLGPAVETGQGGTVLYTGDRGMIHFSRTGEFSATLRAGAFPLGELTAAEHAVQTLALLGFEGETVAVAQEKERTVVTVRQLWQGMPVFTCKAALVYEGGALIAIRGGESYRLTGSPVPSGEAEPLSVATALLRFLEGLNKLGGICTELTDMTPGYAFTPGLNDPVTLYPVWYFTTDTGAYYLDAGTGTLERADRS